MMISISIIIFIIIITTIYLSFSLGDLATAVTVVSLSQELMRDPVLLLEDGITYERSAIEKRLKDTSISPSTGEPVLDQRLIPNVALRKSIEAFHAHPGGPRGRRQGRSQQPEPAELP